MVQFDICLQILSLEMISCICNDWWNFNGYSYNIPFIWMLSALIVPRHGRRPARPALWGTNPRPRWWWTGLSLWDLWLEVRCQIWCRLKLVSRGQHRNLCTESMLGMLLQEHLRIHHVEASHPQVLLVHLLLHLLRPRVWNDTKGWRWRWGHRQWPPTKQVSYNGGVNCGVNGGVIVNGHQPSRCLTVTSILEHQMHIHTWYFCQWIDRHK